MLQIILNDVDVNKIYFSDEISYSRKNIERWEDPNVVGNISHLKCLNMIKNINVIYFSISI